MTRKTLFAFLLLAAVTGARAQPSLPASGLKPDIAAQRYGKTAQTLDIYRPATSAVAHHAVIHIHGGGFKSGSRHMANPALVKALLAKGYAVVMVDYRLSGEAPFPAAVQDVFAAMAYLRANAEKLKLTGKIFVYGESAGANLATLVGTAYNDAVFRQDVADKGESIRPDGVVALYPPVDFGQIDTMLRAQGCDAARINHDTAAGFESQYLGTPVASAPDKVRQANPITYITGTLPAFLLQNGDRDCDVGSGQAGLLAAALRHWGMRVTHETLAGAGHGGPLFESEANIARIVDFIEAH